jgi:hypothetical protein
MNFNVTALKDKCKEKGLSSSGSKGQLIERLLGVDSVSEAGGKSSSGAAGRAKKLLTGRGSGVGGSSARKKRVVEEEEDDDEDSSDSDGDGTPTVKNTRLEGVGYQRIPLRSDEIFLRDYVMGHWSSKGAVQWYVAQVAEILAGGIYGLAFLGDDDTTPLRVTMVDIGKRKTRQGPVAPPSFGAATGVAHAVSSSVDEGDTVHGD